MMEKCTCRAAAQPTYRVAEDTLYKHNAASAILTVLLGPPPPWLIMTELRSLLLHASGF
jgi:hypothetical protein